MKKLCVFGSARYDLDPDFYKKAYSISAKAVKKGYATITGAGPGIMESANKGCTIAGGVSYGARINLPFEQSTNDYISVLQKFDKFEDRKRALIEDSDAFVVLPGGFGTLDELFEILTLMQCGKMEKKPVILVGSQFWSPMYYFIVNNLMGKTISRKDLDLFTIVDEVHEVMHLL